MSESASPARRLSGKAATIRSRVAMAWSVSPDRRKGLRLVGGRGGRVGHGEEGRDHLGVLLDGEEAPSEQQPALGVLGIARDEGPQDGHGVTIALRVEECPRSEHVLLGREGRELPVRSEEALGLGGRRIRRPADVQLFEERKSLLRPLQSEEELPQGERGLSGERRGGIPVEEGAQDLFPIRVLLQVETGHGEAKVRLGGEAAFGISGDETREVSGGRGGVVQCPGRLGAIKECIIGEELVRGRRLFEDGQGVGRPVRLEEAIAGEK
jgi:hypothetical protein